MELAKTIVSIFYSTLDIEMIKLATRFFFLPTESWKHSVDWLEIINGITGLKLSPFTNKIF